MKMILMTAPETEAETMVSTLVEERLVACGNIVRGVRSIYRWEGKTCDDIEALVIMETADEHVAAAVDRIVELHSYDCPKVVSWDPSLVHDPYLRWVIETTRRRDHEP